ncbi:VOC family protein [Shewanella waksmanii]|uniref:VOC family protein n=1 Tax=Shewanella waksmanii TaxID=213783 RepID=UPI003736A761
MSEHNKINYLEIPSQDLAISKAFFKSVFGWGFIDYGREYTCFTNAGITGGFYLSNQQAQTQHGSVLMVMYSDNLSDTEQKIIAANGQITKPTFSFPGGQRFHFSDPNGNEYAVWTE